MSNIWGDIFAILLLSLVASLVICTLHLLQQKTCSNQDYLQQICPHCLVTFAKTFAKIKQKCHSFALLVIVKWLASVSVWQLLFHLLFSYSPKPSLSKSLFSSDVRCVMRNDLCFWCGDSVLLKLKYFLLVLIYGTVTRQVLHRNVLMLFLFRAHLKEWTKIVDMFWLNLIQLTIVSTSHSHYGCTYFVYCKSPWQNPFKIIALFNCLRSYRVQKPECALCVLCFIPWLYLPWVQCQNYWALHLILMFVTFSVTIQQSGHGDGGIKNFIVFKVEAKLL